MAPELSVVVPTHDRPLRLRWLLNALEDQDLARDRWELLVADDSEGTETTELLRTHPVGVRAIAFPAGTAGPAVKRNAAWRAARGELVVFTDDDCRPPVDWLRRALEAGRRHPGAVVQGATSIDPDELGVFLHAPLARSQDITPPVPWAQTCNILYPRAVLEALGGFDEAFPLAAGEDTDLALRAVEAGVDYVGAPEVLTHHAVEAGGLVARLRETWRWQHLPALVRRHPGLREHYTGGGWFWKPAHVRVPGLLAAAAALGARRPVLAVALAAPWVQVALPSYGSGPRGRLRALAELPSRAVLDVAEVAALARGSVRHRSLLL